MAQFTIHFVVELNLLFSSLQYVRMGPMAITVSTTVAVTVTMILPVTDRLVTVKGDVNRDILTRSALNVSNKSRK